MRRRKFITILGGAAVALPFVARAQERVRRIGILYAGAIDEDAERETRLAGFRAGMSRLGWTEGRNLHVVVRTTAGDPEQIRAHAAELAVLSPEVVLVVSNPVLAAMRRAAPDTPIVFTQVGDPVGSNFVASLARPGGNITGFMHYEPAMGGKWLEVLKEIAPAMARALVLLHPDVTANVEFLRAAEAAGSSNRVAVSGAGVRSTGDVVRAIESFSGSHGGVIILPNPVTGGSRKVIADLAIRHRLPTVGAFRYLAANGVLISYGLNVPAVFQSAATYVDRILKGEKPSNLPVQAPATFELVINLNTAKALGLAVPPSLLARANEVIE